MFPAEFILDVARRAGREPRRLGAGNEWIIKCPRSDRHQNGDAHPSRRTAGTAIRAVVAVA